MAHYRQIHTKIWKDGWFLDLPHDQKLLFIYLFSNERANLLGLYDLSPRVMAFETGLTMEQVNAGLLAFENAGKAIYEDGWIWIPNLLRYNAGNLSSPKIQQHIRSTLRELPDIPLRQTWIAHYNRIFGTEYPIDTVCIPSSTEHDTDTDTEHENDTDTEHDDDTEECAAVVAVLEAFGMDNVESAAQKAVSLGWKRQHAESTTAYAKQKGLGTGWLHDQCMMGKAWRPTVKADSDDRSGYAYEAGTERWLRTGG